MRCPDCLRIVENGADNCPKCGCTLNGMEGEVYHLRPNTLLHNRYVLGKVLGFGGFGVVYKAWDETLERIVAVKEYFPTIFLNRDRGTCEVQIFDAKNKEAFERGKEEFLLEARNIAKYNTHPNIVHVYDYFEENGTAYFVMEYLDGHTLREYINLAVKNGYVFTVKSAVHIVLEVLNALKATHADGIIHRDIKPNNVVVLRNGTVKLFDFGAARFSDSDTEMTRTVIISPGYAPAEQYQMKSKQGPYTDIYAVGAVLYEMLTGVKPDESVNRKVEDTLEPPSSINSKVSYELDNIVMRAMAVRSEIRFKTSKEFYKALESGKNVRNAEKEIHRRKSNRNRIILTMFLVIIALGAYAGYRIYNDYRYAVLEEAVINLWVSEMDGDSEHTLEIYRKMSEEFIEKNPQITIEYTVIPEDDYSFQLASAFNRDNGPDLFVNPGQGIIGRSFLADIGMVYDDANYNADEYRLIGDKREYYIENGFLPLMIDVEVIYRNIMVEGLPISHDYSEFKENKADYIGMLKDNTNVQSDMAGMYEIDPYQDDVIYGNYSLCFSINDKSDKAKKKASARLLNYFLSDNAQEYLCVEEEKGIPLNKDVWDIYMQINYDFSFLTDSVNEIVFR